MKTFFSIFSPHISQFNTSNSYGQESLTDKNTSSLLNRH